MKESYRKGVASHPDPESCVGSRKAAGEALTGAHAGWVWSCEIIATGVPTSFRMAEGNTDGCAIASIKHPQDSAQSQTPSMYGNSTRENRETPSTPVVEGVTGRLEKALSQKSNTHVDGESDGRVVPTKCPTTVESHRRRVWREGDRPRRTSGRRPRPGRRAGPARRATCSMCVKQRFDAKYPR